MGRLHLTEHLLMRAAAPRPSITPRIVDLAWSITHHKRAIHATKGALH